VLRFAVFSSKAGNRMRAKMVIAVLLTTLGQGVSVRAQDAPGGSAVAGDKKSSNTTLERRAELEELKQAAARYRITTDAEPPRNLILLPEPALHWTNPLRRTFDGAVFLWVVDGRPEAVASLYRYTHEGRIVEDHEFQSLATAGLTATRDGQLVWTPRSAGISLALIPGAPKPASTPAERLRQMQALAREFHAFFNAPEDRSELRLLPKPLYRYETERPRLLDGAMFAFVLTTDPEVLLMVEARPVEGTTAWHYGFARMSMVNLRAAHKEQTVWTVDWVYDLEAPNKPYVTLRAPDRRN
jgi:hypothetical protein